MCPAKAEGVKLPVPMLPGLALGRLLEVVIIPGLLSTLEHLL